jgi:hypothetical protein
MLILMTSPDFVIRGGTPDPSIVAVLREVAGAKNPVGLISNHGQPSWFEANFANTKVQFLHVPGRQKGEIVAHNAAKFSLNPFDVLVLAVKAEDVQMGKNGGAVLVAAGWGTAPQVKALGIRVDDAKGLKEVVDLTSGWSGQWWFSGNGSGYGVRALADLSGKGHTITQQQQLFGQKLTAIVKNGGSRLNALLVVTARSLLMDGVGSKENLVWGVYPSSNISSNADTEVLSDFTHRLRTTVSRVQYCKRGEPLFIRHKASSKRSLGGGANRTDPTEQILTLHLNPFYKEKQRLVGKNVIVVDDCATYGVSFGVAAALLRKAGAASVTGVALGKFGNQLRYFEIDIQMDPFMPIASTGFCLAVEAVFSGATSATTQQVLQSLIV